MVRHSPLAGAILLVTLVLQACTGSGGREFEFEPPVFPPPPEKARFIWERTLTNSLDVKEQTAMDKLKQLATGSGASAFGLVKPWGIAVNRGRVYVCDTVQRAVLLFDAPGKDFKHIGTEGVGQLFKPIGIAVSRADGTVYVADNTAKRVVAFDKDGEYLRAIGGTEIFKRPTGVTVSPDGSRIYVIDNGGVETDEHKMHIFDAINGHLIKTVGVRGKELGEFNLPLQAAASPDGTIHVVDGGNFRVQSFDSNGGFISSFGSIGTRSGQFSRPKGIATDTSGNIYVVDSSFGNFQIFSGTGELLLFVGERSFKGGPAAYMLPTGIAVDEDGRVYVADQYYKKVDVYRPADLPPGQGFFAPVSNKKKRSRR
ncbi:MAG: 6-bladed beta-propeller [Gammaproteobacteria bacterium]|nr:6-bladed beta-propeller [Gammaproteobacteria bacterium]MDH5800846.1 6-bladed beta-propeller [Gammaproteobacteria bacterium]